MNEKNQKEIQPFLWKLFRYNMTKKLNTVGGYGKTGEADSMKRKIINGAESMLLLYGEFFQTGRTTMTLRQIIAKLREMTEGWIKLPGKDQS